MTTRYSHYLFRRAPAKWPRAVVCLDCASTATRLPGRQVRECEQLLAWHTVCMSGNMSIYACVRTASGQDAIGLWSALADLTEHPGVVWIVGYQLTRLWSLLGMWERLENGTLETVSAAGRLPRASRAEMREVRKGSVDPLGPVRGGQVRALRLANQGYVVTEGPPCIARVRIADRPGWLQWVDSENYGVSPSAESVSGPGVARWLADWWSSSAALLEQYGLGPLSTTAGSSAMGGWRSLYYPPGVYCHVHPVAAPLERAGYYGGRCECYRIGVLPGQVWHYDVRSMYPSVCMGAPLPVALERVEDTPEAAKRLVLRDPLSAVARVTLSTDEPAYPYRRAEDTIFPVGTYQTTLCGPELDDALRHRRIKRFHCAASYQMDGALAGYTNAAYAMRCAAEVAGNRGAAQLAKALAVCLPGKLGQYERRWVFEPSIVPPMPYGEWRGTDTEGVEQRYRAIAGDTYRYAVLGTAPDAVPAMAAWVTAHGRMLLLKYIRTAGWSEVHYVDTDSLILSADGVERLRQAGCCADRVAGMLELRAGPCQVELRGVKWYREGELLVCAGLPRGNVGTGTDGLAYWRQISAAEQAAAGKRPTAERVLRAWGRTGEYRHGVVREDGVVLPHELREE